MWPCSAAPRRPPYESRLQPRAAAAVPAQAAGGEPPARLRRDPAARGPLSGPVRPLARDHLPATGAPGGRGPGHPEPGGRPQDLQDHRRRPPGAGRPAGGAGRARGRDLRLGPRPGPRDSRRGPGQRPRPEAGAQAGRPGDPPRAAPRKPLAPRPRRRPSSGLVGRGRGLRSPPARGPRQDLPGPAPGPAHRGPAARVRGHPRRGLRAHPPDPQDPRRATPRPLKEPTEMQTSAAIEARDLTKTYGKDDRALDGLGFAVEGGTVFGLLGPNGAGKSTTVKILTTLTRPDSGQASVAGVDVLAHPERVRRTIGLVAQRSGVDLEATGRENLTLQGQVYGLRGAELRTRVGELLERFGLAEAADRVARGYSGGMQRRLDIAMGLIHRPQVLFLDEPTSGLDPEIRADMWAEIAHLSGSEGLTILLTTHYLEEADRLAGRLAIVDRGRVVAEGSPNELKGQLRGDAIQVELGDPETNGRASSALDRVPGVWEVTIEGRSLRARTDDGSAAVPAVLQALEAGGVRVASVTIARPSLDDVYLRHTGRSFRRTEEPV